jgi:ferritin-like metal-binding protein YciE
LISTIENQGDASIRVIAIQIFQSKSSKGVPMKFFSGNIESLRELYVNELRTLLSAEQQITEALPKMIQKATDTQLKQALQSHLRETQAHVTRLEQVLSEQGKVSASKSKVAATLISEAETMIKDAADDSVRDAVIIASAQKFEHFEIAAYGTVRSWANILGQSKHAQILDQTLQEEGHADKLLTSISDRVNPYAEKAA